MCEIPQPRHEIARGKNRILGKMLDKYPASFKQIRSVVNHSAADKNSRPTWKSRKEICGSKQAKTWLLMAV